MAFMKKQTMYSINFQVLIVFISILATGCSTDIYHDERFVGEGFRTLFPGHQAQVVIGGNRYEAVLQATDWFNENQFLVVQRWVTDEAIEREPNFKTRQRAQLLFLAHKVKAPLAVFLQVQEKPWKQNSDRSNIHTQQHKIIEIEIRGLNAESAEIVFEAKAWNSEPLIKTQQLVRALTTFALDKALEAPQASSLPSQKIMHQEKQQREHVTIYPTIRQKEISGIPLAPSPVEDHSDQTIPISDDSLHVKNVISTKEDGTAPTMAEDPDRAKAEYQPFQSEKLDQAVPGRDSSLGLQITSGTLSVLYLPFKATYALLGGFFGGLAYVLTAGDETVTHAIWDASVGGTYWLTPQHLRGNQPVHFMGQSNHGRRSP